jgi:hypothetical protein
MPPTIRDPRARLLTRHFLRRFLDNDLISPHVDLHENVAVILAGIISTAIFVSFLFSMKYLAGYPAPAMTETYAMGDKAFFLGAAMIVMALVAAMQWDALALDARDAANLAPLPIARSTLVIAKTAALVLFASTFAFALTVVPSLLYSILHITRLPVGILDIAHVLITHLAVTLAACAFGFAAVVAVRETLRAALGERTFRRASPLVQAALVLFLLSMFLLLPGLPERVAEGWPKKGFPNAHYLPPMWFLGLWEYLSGDVVMSLHPAMPPRVAERNAFYDAQYRSNIPLFGELGRIAVAAFAGVIVTAVLAYAWNARRLPQPLAASQRHRRTIGALTWLFAGRSPTCAAGFSFALCTIARSAPHRLAIAAAAAAALATSFVVLSVLTPQRVLMHQAAVIGLLILGFRHAVRMPAEFRASWIFQVAATDGLRRYTSGVKRAGFVGLAAPAVIILIPLAVSALGRRGALAHAAIGLMFAIAAIEVAFVRAQQLPLVSQYVPGGNFKKVGPIGGIAFFVFAYIFAAIERRALASVEGTAIMLGVLAAIFVVARVVDVWKRDARATAAFEEPPDTATQWLGLSH